jgi:hypothetical protein
VRGVRVVADVEREEHLAARVQAVLEAQRFRKRPQAAAHRYAVQQHAQSSIETAGAAVIDAAMLVFEAPQPVFDARIAAAVRFRCPQNRFTVQQPTKLDQIPGLVLQGERPCRSEGPLVGCIPGSRASVL